jgi:signal transduction histidine kinase/PAS domain-containing protein
VDQDWIKSPTARRVLTHWADARPAWLWSQDGVELIWRNEAAAAFAARMRRGRIGMPVEAVPIRGQITRLMRLGTPGRTSLSRVQFLAGDRPLATTCHCTPLSLPDGQPGLLIVGVDPVAPEQVAARKEQGVAHDPLPLALFPAGSEYLLINEDGQIASGSPGATDAYAPQIESEGLPPLDDGESGVFPFGAAHVSVGRYRASPQDAMLLVFGGEALASAQPEPGVAPVVAIEDPGPEVKAQSFEDAAPASISPRPGNPTQSLAELFDALMVDKGLYEPLTSADEHFAGPPAVAPADMLTPTLEVTPPVAAAAAVVPVVEPALDETPQQPTEPAITQLREDEGMDPEPHLPDALPADDAIGALIAEADAEQFAEDAAAELLETPVAEVPRIGVVPPQPKFAPAEAAAEPAAEAAAEPAPAPPAYDGPVTLWRITGRSFTPNVATAEATLGPDAPDDELPEAVEPGAVGLSSDEMSESTTGFPDRETVERVSRYNFDELGRILADRVANPRPEDKPKAPAPSESSLVPLPGETLVLNRLPLGILVFRDQQVLFANRAMTELLGHESIEALRRAGLDSVFPSELVAGPVTRLVKSDGSALPVSARLQSISWNGKPALMLSAAIAETRLGHEAAVRTFAELAADTAEDGFLLADRAGLVTLVSLHGRVLLGRLDTELVGRALAGLVSPLSVPELRAFLERPARFAETARPAVVLPFAEGDLDLVLFAEGQAGIVAGYFGFIRRRVGVAQSGEPFTPTGTEIEPTILARISRGLRRPLNTVIGFADMIRLGSEAERAEEYAGDIKSAGEEMALLVGELDDYTRLSEGRYPLEPDEIDLASLLESCLGRVRGQAAHARVFVRSAVSEHLPHISADRASLTQAVLNLLASAIDQTPPGGSVILSAQREDAGAVVVNVRDSGDPRRDLGERFVVFRDGLGRNGEALMPVRSSVGLALTRSLLAVNALKLTVDPAAAGGTLFSLVVPPDLVRVG